MNNKSVLVHHGIKGQRWGIRRYQNEDGSLTKAGESRYKTESDSKSPDTTVRKKKSKLDESITGRKLMDAGKKYIVGATIASAAFAAIAIPTTMAIGKRFLLETIDGM